MRGLGSWILLLFFWICFGANAQAAQSKCQKPLLFFDLGNTLLRTDFDSKTHEIKTVRYFPQVKNYLSGLKKQNFRIGLIVNLPENWGDTREAKITALKSFVRTHWVDSTRMDWSVFDLGILVPQNDSQRKPAPMLFQEALGIAKREGCVAVYQSESQREVIAANGVGLLAHEVEKSKNVARSLLTAEEISQIRTR